MIYIADVGTCPKELADIFSIVKWVVTLICWAIPVILIVLCILDLAKIVTAGNANDEKVKKEATNKIVTRIVFAVIIFLVPTIIRLIFGWIPVVKDNKDTLDGATWQDCWDGKIK